MNISKKLFCLFLSISCITAIPQTIAASQQSSATTHGTMGALFLYMGASLFPNPARNLNEIILELLASLKGHPITPALTLQRLLTLITILHPKTPMSLKIAAAIVNPLLINKLGNRILNLLTENEVLTNATQIQFTPSFVPKINFDNLALLKENSFETTKCPICYEEFSKIFTAPISSQYQHIIMIPMCCYENSSKKNILYICANDIISWAIKNSDECSLCRQRCTDYQILIRNTPHTRSAIEYITPELQSQLKTLMKNKPNEEIYSLVMRIVPVGLKTAAQQTEAELIG